MTDPSVLVSVVIPVFGGNPDDLRLALASLVAQTYPTWEAIVVDDGSDPPVEVAPDPRIRLIRMAGNEGRGAARRAGIRAARGSLIALQDADDWSYPERLATQVAFFGEHPEIDLVGSGAMLVEGRHAVVVGTSPRTATVASHPLIHPTLVMRREVFATAEYDPAFRTAEDFDFLARALPHHRHASLPQPLYAYRMAGSASVRKYWASQWVRLRVGSRGAGVATRVILACSLGARAIVYTLASLLGLRRRIVYRGRRPPNRAEESAFVAARDAVEAVRDGGIGTPPGVGSSSG